MNFYDVIGVSENASEEEVRKAYIDAVKKYHPDNFTNASEEDKDKNTQRLQLLNHAWNEYKNGYKGTTSPKVNKQTSSHNPYESSSFKQQFHQAYTDFMNSFTSKADNGINEFQRKRDSLKAALNERARVVRMNSYQGVANMKEQSVLLNNEIEALRRVIQDSTTAIIQKRNELTNLHNRKMYRLMPERFKSEDNILMSQLEELEKKSQALQNELNKKIQQYNQIQMEIRNYPEECVRKDSEVIRLQKELSDIEQAIKEFGQSTRAHTRK